MKISKMAKIFDICRKSDSPVRMEGLHGIGKSMVPEKWAEKNGFLFIPLFLSQQEVGDLIGIPFNKDGQAIEDYDGTQAVMHWSKPAWLDRMEEAAARGIHSVLLLDELSRAQLDVRQSVLQLVLEGKIHDHRLPIVDGIKTFIIAADNPAELYQTEELDPALLDRFATFDVEVDVDGWLEWARDNNVEVVVTDFIAEYPDKLHFQHDADKGSTPRGLVKLSDILKNVGDATEFILPLINSRIGETVGASFFHFYNNYSKVMKVEDIIRVIDKENSSKDSLDGQTVQENLATKISELTTEIEAQSASELAEKFRIRIEGDKKEPLENYLMIYLASLNGEIMSGILKGWKNSKNAWFFKLMGKVPGQYLTARMLAATSN